MLTKANRAREHAMRLAEEALQLFENSGLTELAETIESRLPFIRAGK